MDFDEKALQTVREDRLLIDAYDQWLYNEFDSYVGKRILEVGCGMGNLTRHLIQKELLVSIDISPESIQALQKQYSDQPNFLALQMSITDPEVLSLKNHNLDTVISLNVFEHIENDRLALEHVWNLLPPDGSLILIVPAHSQLYGSMDRSIGHYRRYSKGQLKNELQQFGFQVVRQKYVNVPGAVGWFVNGRILKRVTPPSGQLRLINTLIPMIRWSEHLVPPPFGISLLSIAKKVS